MFLSVRLINYSILQVGLKVWFKRFGIGIILALRSTLAIISVLKRYL